MSPLTQSPRVRKVAVVLGVASLGSTAAYGVGTQVGNGVAGANQSSSSASPRGPSTADLQALADKLGVSVAKLEAALDATRPAKPTPRPSSDPFAAALAKELGLDQATVASALSSWHPAHGPGHGGPGGPPPGP